jgi:hypothetical protein
MCTFKEAVQLVFSIKKLLMSIGMSKICKAVPSSVPSTPKMKAYAAAIDGYPKCRTSK